MVGSTGRQGDGETGRVVVWGSGSGPDRGLQAFHQAAVYGDRNTRDVTRALGGQEYY